VTATSVRRIILACDDPGGCLAVLVTEVENTLAARVEAGRKGWTFQARSKSSPGAGEGRQRYLDFCPDHPVPGLRVHRQAV
jgi:hypothetical protein